MNLNPPTESQLLVFWVSLLVILVTARLFGYLMQRIGQPAVVGELAAGLVLGPSILGRLAPGVTDWLFPADDAQTAMIFTIGWIGVLLLLVVTGYETDLGLIRRLGRAAAYVSTGSLVVPAAAGLAVGWMIPTAFIGDDTEPYIFALFIAAALSISSLPVIAKILSEMGFMRRNFGQVTLAAGMANDVVGWIALGLIAGLAQAGGFKWDKLAITVGGLVIFFLLAFTVGQRLVDHSLQRLRATGNNPMTGLTIVLVTALSFGVVTQWLHVEAVLGAFVAGVILARSRFSDHDLIAPLESMTAAVFAPIFFATAGLRVDLWLLADMETAIWAVVVLAAASASKFFGSLIGARLSKLPVREGAALGVGLNARGALEIVIAAVGLSLGVLNNQSYTVIVLMAMATSMLAPPVLRRVLRDWEGSAEERQRLDLENQLAENEVVVGGRILIPTRGGLTSLLAAQIADLAWPSRAEVTVLTTGEKSTSDLGPLIDVLGERSVDLRHRPTDNPVDAIIDEAMLHYDAVVIGAGTDSEGGFGPLVSDVLRRCPIPVVVVRPPRRSAGLPWAFARGLVPVNGARSSRPAQEIAGYISGRIGTQLSFLHVSAAPVNVVESVLGDHSPHDRQARSVLHEAAALATTAGANFSAVVEHADNPGVQIAATADELDVDVVVVAGRSRTNAGKLSLGQTIPAVLRSIDCTIIAVFVPEPSVSESYDAPDTPIIETAAVGRDVQPEPVLV